MKSFPLIQRSTAAVIVAAMLAGVSGSALADKKWRTRDYAPQMQKAEGYVRAGKVEDALISFDSAAQADPTRKEPWVRSAQLHFDAGHYGRAIVAAEEVLRRDPADKVADSVLTVSGLRVAAQSLQRLQANGGLHVPTARKEAEVLARTMRSTMGTAVFANVYESGPGPVKPKRTKARPKATAPKPAADANANPFDTPSGG
jgi:Tfp pilus assembly protein PilF